MAGFDLAMIPPMVSKNLITSSMPFFVHCIFFFGKFLVSPKIPPDVRRHNIFYGVKIPFHITVKKFVDDILVCHITIHLIFKNLPPVMVETIVLPIWRFFLLWNKACYLATEIK